MAQSNEPGFTTAQQKLAHLPATSILAGQLQAALASGDVQALHELFDAQEQQAREAIASWQAIRQRTREEFARTLRSPSTGLPAHIICPGCGANDGWWMKVLSDGRPSRQFRCLRFANTLLQPCLDFGFLQNLDCELC